jgi:transcriptional regulator with XRE-family HTH domain
MKRIRESRGLSQEELAEESGLSIQIIRLYEQKPASINNAKLISLVKIARVLNCKISDLIDDKELKADFESCK